MSAAYRSIQLIITDGAHLNVCSREQNVRNYIRKSTSKTALEEATLEANTHTDYCYMNHNKCITFYSAITTLFT